MKRPTIVRVILETAADICHETMPTEIDSPWTMIANWIPCTQRSNEEPLSILASLLCYATSQSSQKISIVEGITTLLDESFQRAIMHVIQSQHTLVCTPQKDGQHHHHQQQQHQQHQQQYLHPEESYLEEIINDEDNESLLGSDEESVHNKENSIGRNVNTSMISNASFLRSPLRSTGRSPLATYSSPFGSSIKGFDSNNNNMHSNATTTTTTPPRNYYAYSSKNASAKKVIKMEKENSDLAATNKELVRELDAARQTENQLRGQLEELQAKNRATRMKIESEALNRENELRQELMEKNSTLEKELKKYKETSLEGSLAKEQLSALQDEIDVMRHSQLKLQHLEDQYRKVKEKLEQMGDVSKALESEEKAHSEAVSKCLQLENELALLQPLKRQLEDYKARATDAEVRLVDCEDEIKKLREASQNLNGIHNELQKGSLQHMIEAEELRKRLQDNDESDVHGLGVGEGLSELNPELKEELLRLRSENSRLKDFASKREHDSVQQLEEQKDDADRLAKKFKEQFLATKSVLEKVQHQLDASLEREKVLKAQIVELEHQKSDLEQELQNERVLAQEARIEAEQHLEKALRDLKKQSLEEQERLTQEYEHRLLKSEEESKHHYQELERVASCTESRLKQSLEDLRNEHTASLAALNEERDRKIDELSKCHADEMKALMESSEKERTELMERGKKMLQEKNEKIRQLEENIDSLSRASQTKEQELITLKQNQVVFEEKVANKIVSYKQRLNRSLAEAEENARECDDLQSRLKKLESEKSNLQQENDRFRRQLGGRFGADTGAYEELKREFNVLLEENRALKRYKSSSNEIDVFSVDGSAHAHNTRGSVSASSLSQLRAEYEDKIEELNDEKRELVLKNTALVTEEARIQKRAFELEVEVQKLRQDKISLELQIERNQMQAQVNFSPEESTGVKRSAITNQPSSPTIVENMSTEVVAIESPNCSYRNVEIFSPSLRNAGPVTDVGAFKNKLQERLNTKRTSPSKSLSLMDMASFGN